MNVCGRVGVQASVQAAGVSTQMQVCECKGVHARMCVQVCVSVRMCVKVCEGMCVQECKCKGVCASVCV